MQPQPNPNPSNQPPNTESSPNPLSDNFSQPQSQPNVTQTANPSGPESLNPTISQPSVNSATSSSSSTDVQNPQSTSPVPQPQSKPKLFAKGSFKHLIKQGSFWLLIAMSFFGLMGIIVGAIGVSAEVDALNQKAEAEKKLTSMRKTLLGYATRLGIKVDEDGQPIEGEVPSSQNIASKNYLYIGEWGLKIYIPNSLKDVSYTFSNIVPKSNEPSDKANDTFVCITAIPQTATYTPEFAQLDKNPYGLGCLYRSQTKTPASTSGRQWRLVKWDSKYYYNYTHPQPNFSKDKTELTWETIATESVQSMLTNVEGITEF